MIFFDDGSPAYITKRFDYKPDGTKYQVEDFATLSGKSPEREGVDFKYNASYADMAGLIKQYVPAATVELINFFRIVLFNYLFGNGDAHLKNFSLMESEQGDYLLAPAYDLLCTALHINDADLAMHNGLYTGALEDPGYSKFGSYTGQSFLVFTEKIGVRTTIARGIIDDAINSIHPAFTLIDRSFLTQEAKETYKLIVRDRYSRIQQL